MNRCEHNFLDTETPGGGNTIGKGRMSRHPKEIERKGKKDLNEEEEDYPVFGRESGDWGGGTSCPLKEMDGCTLKLCGQRRKIRGKGFS